MRLCHSSFGLGNRPEELVALAGSARRAAVIVNALDRVRDIPIERRDGRELSHIEGRTLSGAVWRAGKGGDPARGQRGGEPRLRSHPGAACDGERGVCPASEAGLLSLYPAQRSRQSASLRLS